MLHHRTFESIRRYNGENAEFWSARELQPLLEYATWDKFRRVIDKASEACERSAPDEPPSHASDRALCTRGLG